MALLKENILYSLDTTPLPDNEGSVSAVDIILGYINKELQENGDRIYTREAENMYASQNLVQERRLSEVIPLSSGVARALLRRGLQKGDVVQFHMHNNTDLHMLALGVWMAGGTVSLLNPLLTLSIVRKFLELTRPKFIFCSGDLVGDARKASEMAGHNDVEIVVVNSPVSVYKGAFSLKEFVAEDGLRCNVSIPDVHKTVSPNDLAVIFCSSGSTGDPKGIKMNHTYVIRCLGRPFLPGHSRPGQTYVSSVGLYHCYGFFLHLTSALCNEGTFIFFCIRKKVELGCLFNVVNKYQPSIVTVGFHSGIEMSKSKLTNNLNLTCVELLIPVGSSLRQEMIERLQEKYVNAKIMNLYGMTEIGHVGLSFTYDNLGSLARGIRIKVVNPDTQEVLIANQVGEILIKGEMMLEGYLGLPEELANAAFTADGYFRSGDLGYYDENGQLYYKDRLKLLMKYNNRHVYPRELEELIQELPGVVDVGVFGIPDEDMQERITAVVVVAPGSNVSETEIEERVNHQVPWYMHIRGGVHFVDIIPRNNMGKVMKGALKELLQLQDQLSEQAGQTA